MTATDTAVAIDLTRGCTDVGCVGFAAQVGAQLGSGGYTWPVSVIEVDDYGQYIADHTTARRRANRSRRLGYRFAEVALPDHIDEIHEVNTSLDTRQGRPMAESYLKRPSPAHLPLYPCPRHAIRTFAVLAPDDTLVAYLVAYVVGDLLMFSQILGHGAHLPNDVMYLLATGVIETVAADAGPVAVFYNRHDSGTDGLRYFKHRLGMRATRVEWRT